MIASIHIKNFRCFRDLEINDLGAINVIVGDNGAGKTALLEGILMGAGTPELAINLKQARGVMLNAFIGLQQKAAYESLWNDIFTGLSPNRVIEISLNGTAENSRQVRIYYESETQRTIPLDTQLPFGTNSTPPSSNQIVFETKDPEGHHDFLRPKVSSVGNLVIEGERSVPNASIFLHAASFPPAQSQTVQDFDTVSRRNGETAFIEAFSKVFPKVNNLSVIGGALHCSLSDFPEKIPVSYISNGINKLLAIMLGIANRTNGVYMIDEIDNGFYYLRMPLIWDAINKFSEEFKVQLFVSTHSKECLDSLLPIVEKNPGRFRLIRVEELEDTKEHTVRVFSGNVFRSILKTNEVDARSGN